MHAHVLAPLADPGATFNGTRSYRASTSLAQAAHLDDLDGLIAAGWTFVSGRGIRRERPKRPEQGELFLDYRFRSMLIFDMGDWRDVITGRPVD